MLDLFTSVIFYSLLFGSLLSLSLLLLPLPRECCRLVNPTEGVKRENLRLRVGNFTCWKEVSECISCNLSFFIVFPEESQWFHRV